MVGQPSLTERDSIGTATGGVGLTPSAYGIGGGNLGTKSVGDSLPHRLPCGASDMSVPGGSSCRGQSLMLQHTLLAEALTRGSGLCISECNAYIQVRGGDVFWCCQT